jgi:SNF2 family DNA or RNA helicase
MVLSKKYHKLKDGNFINLEDKKLEGIREIIQNFKLDTKDVAKGLAKIPKFNIFYLDEKFNDLDLNFIERDLSFKEVIQNFKGLKESKNIKFDIPKELENVMRDYQKDGYTWFKTLQYYGFGGILADEMGLGKTIQTIGFIKSRVEEFKNRGEKSTSFVVVPTSILYNWKDEIKKFAPDLNVLMLEGNASNRMSLMNEIEDNDIVITSYGTLRNDIDLYKNIKFDIVIIDEAQNVKNRKALAARAIREIKGNAYYALTGTPMENSLSELWSVFDFIMPGYLGAYSEFEDKYENPISKSKDEEAYKDLLKHIKPFILRRFKKDVIKELPEKIEKNVVLEMTEEQKKIYYAYLQKAKSEYEEELRGGGTQGSRIKMLSILMRLRQIFYALLLSCLVNFPL